MPFYRDEEGQDRYARDRNGNEMYPKRKKDIFARDSIGEEYYARDKLGNECYPCLKNKSILIPNRLARYSNGNQRYPTDSRGNEYYLQDQGKPYLLYQEDGQTYLAKNRKCIPMIPWNFLQFMDDKPYVYIQDSAGNCVYVHETDMSQSLKMICSCLCQCVTLCPSLL
ncbi:hypothetical protein JTE90_011751 [Oedothorax gibbosus]|uniref:Uncharacterized protein n=1 Tax=Oedothorax gibbosus TaxID=931172 RepID=A0AAV6TL41_9ARAC|nr:hypothetical protein JTE90_011751 [Oedothorax gibbosus]